MIESATSDHEEAGQLKRLSRGLEKGVDRSEVGRKQAYSRMVECPEPLRDDSFYVLSCESYILNALTYLSLRMVPLSLDYLSNHSFVACLPIGVVAKRG